MLRLHPSPFISHLYRQATIAYIRELVVTYGPFDGIAGFSEGAATMHELLCLQASGVDVGLGGIRFCIAMSPWISPHRTTKLPAPLRVELLSTQGRKDSRMFKDSLPLFEADFARVQRFEHNGRHRLIVMHLDRYTQHKRNSSAVLASGA